MIHEQHRSAANAVWGRDPTTEAHKAEDFRKVSVTPILLLLVAMILMAKKPSKRRRMTGYFAGNIDMDMPLGTLAAQTVLLQGVGDVVAEKTFVSSIHNTYTLQGMSPGDNIGPLMVGVAHSDYSTGEVEAWIELSTGWSQADLVSRETANRLIRKIGVFESPLNSGVSSSLNDGRAIKTKLNWTLISGQSLNFFVYNLGTAALGTTDPDVHIEGKANLWAR